MFQIILGYSSTSDLIFRTSDLIFFNSGALPNILHYITLHYIVFLGDPMWPTQSRCQPTLSKYWRNMLFMFYWCVRVTGS